MEKKWGGKFIAPYLLTQLLFYSISSFFFFKNLDHFLTGKNFSTQNQQEGVFNNLISFVNEEFLKD